MLKKSLRSLQILVTMKKTTPEKILDGVSANELAKLPLLTSKILVWLSVVFTRGKLKKLEITFVGNNEKRLVMVHAL